MSRITFLIFDLDDTLIHSNIDYATMKKRITNLFEPNELPQSNLTIKEMLERFQNNPSILRKAYDIIESMESVSATQAEPILYAEQIPGFLKEVNLRSAILTNNSRSSVSRYLQNNKFNYLHNIGPIITRDDISAMKPDPAGLNYILDKFQLKPSEVLFVGDSFIDAEAAGLAELKFILVNYRKLDLSKFSTQPWKVFNKLSEAISFIRSQTIGCIY